MTREMGNRPALIEMVKSWRHLFGGSAGRAAACVRLTNQPSQQHQLSVASDACGRHGWLSSGFALPPWAPPQLQGQRLAKINFCGPLRGTDGDGAITDDLPPIDRGWWLCHGWLEFPADCYVERALTMT